MARLSPTLVFLARLLVAVGLLIELIFVEEFWFHGSGTDLWPLGAMTAIQGVVVWRSVFRIPSTRLLVLAGGLQVVVAVAWVLQPDASLPCCPAPQPFDGAWLVGWTTAGILDLAAAAAALVLVRRGVSGSERPVKSLPR